MKVVDYLIAKKKEEYLILQSCVYLCGKNVSYHCYKLNPQAEEGDRIFDEPCTIDDWTRCPLNT